MEIVTPLIGFSIFPVALGAAFIGYGASGDTTAIAAALVITFVIAGGLWAFARSQSSWRRNARMPNEFLAAILVAVIGFMMLIGGLAALTPIWIVVGLAILTVAWLIQRKRPIATQ